eukprot:Lankesteria_metandrocarpae@DN10518_c0_g2_i1.p1
MRTGSKRPRNAGLPSVANEAYIPLIVQRIEIVHKNQCDKLVVHLKNKDTPHHHVLKFKRREKGFGKRGERGFGRSTLEEFVDHDGIVFIKLGAVPFEYLLRRTRVYGELDYGHVLDAFTKGDSVSTRYADNFYSEPKERGLPSVPSGAPIEFNVKDCHVIWDNAGKSLVLLVNMEDENTNEVEAHYRLPKR